MVVITSSVDLLIHHHVSPFWQLIKATNLHRSDIRESEPDVTTCDINPNLEIQAFQLLSRCCNSCRLMQQEPLRALIVQVMLYKNYAET